MYVINSYNKFQNEAEGGETAPEMKLLEIHEDVLLYNRILEDGAGKRYSPLKRGSYSLLNRVETSCSTKKSTLERASSYRICNLTAWFQEHEVRNSNPQSL
jgi:hypothetical protein